MRTGQYTLIKNLLIIISITYIIGFVSLGGYCPVTSASRLWLIFGCSAFLLIEKRINSFYVITTFLSSGGFLFAGMIIQFIQDTKDLF